MKYLVRHQWLERFGDLDRWLTQVQRHWWGPLSRMLTDRKGGFALFQHLISLRCAVASAAVATRAEVIANYDAATVLVTIHSLASRLTLVVPWRMECQPWLMNAKSSHLYSGDAVLLQVCACRKKHGFHECQHWHRRCTCVIGPVRYLGACQLQHVLHHQSSVVRMQRWTLPMADRHCEQQRLRAAWLVDKARIALQAMHWKTDWSHAFWLLSRSCANSSVSFERLLKFTSDWLVFSSFTWVLRRMSVCSDSVLAAEARKADDASLDTLRTPRPPKRTGRQACVSCCWSDHETSS